MDSIQTLSNRLAIYLAAYKHYVEVKSKARLQEVTIFGESLARDLAEIVFGYSDLVNLNLETNFPAIDLGSLKAACAIQVTITGDSAKIVETQRKFLEYGLDGTYSKLKFIILGDKQGTYESQQIVRAKGTFSFDPYKDIYDLGDLFNILVEAADPAKFEAFSNRLEHELGSAIRPYLLGADRPGQHLRSLLEAHDVRTTDAVLALKPFGISRAIYSNSTSLTEAAGKELIQYVADQFWISDEWIDGNCSHIYSGGPGAEKGTEWRRTLRGAYDLIKRTNLNGERLDLIIPTGISLKEFDSTEDVVDYNAPDYQHFVLIARKKNDFLVDYFRLLLSEPLSYRGCRNGIFLLFLAAEIYEIHTGKKTYINVYEAPKDKIRCCYQGDEFLVDLHRTGQLIDNHKDFFYSSGETVLNATSKVPSRLASLLQTDLAEFAARLSSSLPVTIAFPPTRETAP